MIHVTLAISEFALLMLTALASAAASAVGWVLVAGVAGWGVWRLVRRR